MSDVIPSRREAEAPQSAVSMYAKLASIDEILRGSTKVEQRKILEMLGATRGLTITSSARPLATVVAGSVSTEQKRKDKKASKAPSKATWRSDPSWIAIQERHAAAVAAVKNAPEAEKSALLDTLRSIEQECRALKQQLKGGALSLE
jgi:hypothetical protein